MSFYAKSTVKSNKLDNSAFLLSLEAKILPFLAKNKEKSIAGLLIKTRNPDKPEELESPKEEPSDSIEYCADELIKAVHSKDIKAVAQALRSAFEILDSEPHVEGPHIKEQE